MGTYYGIEYPDDVAPLLRGMETLNAYREALAVLDARWDALALLAPLARAGADDELVADVRARFDGLRAELLATIAVETRALAVARLARRAQAAVDALARDLAPRSAAVNVLASEAAVVEACRADAVLPRADLRRRLAEFADHYPLYDDLALVAADGRVLARLSDAGGARSDAPVLARALASAAPVEADERSDLFDGERELVQAWRVEHEGRGVGVLALRVDLARAARLLFDRPGADDELLAFVDAQGRVVLSNDALRLPPGRTVPALSRADAAPLLLRLGGAPWLVAQRRGSSPPGAGGPDWTALALTPLELAFDAESASGDAPAADFSGEAVFPPRVRALPARADELQRRVDRLVWIARVRQAGAPDDAFARGLGAQLAATGERTAALVARAIGELRAAVVRDLLADATARAALAVDLLDRQLRERADDASWWATTPALAGMDAEAARAALARFGAQRADYANLFVFDDAGRVLASRPDAHLEGRVLSDAWVAECLRLDDPLHDVAATWVSAGVDGGGDEAAEVCAAPVVRDGRAVGGIALVCDGAMPVKRLLRAALPDAAGSVAVFCRPDGGIVGRTAEPPVTLPAQGLALAPGERWSGVLVEDGQAFAVGAAASGPRREFRSSPEGLDLPVICAVVVPCGTVAARPAGLAPVIVDESGGLAIATFRIGTQWMGVAADEVAGCIEVAATVRVWRGGFAQRHVGFVAWRGATLPLIDIAAEFAIASPPQRHAIVLRSGDQSYGLLVSDLGPVARMRISEDKGFAGKDDAWRLIAHLAKSGEVLMPVLLPEAVFGAASA